eukprot:gene6431-11874_t
MTKPARIWIIVSLFLKLIDLSYGDFLLVDVNTTSPVAEIETTFLSIALDSDMIAKDLRPIPFDSPKFLALCEGLSSINVNRPMVYLRIGGSKGDDVVFSETGLDIDSEKYILNSTEWDMINDFAKKMQWKMIFGVNSLERKHDGSWDPTNFIKLLRYTTSKGYVVNYELGNEPDLYLGHRDIWIKPEQLARDFGMLKAIVIEEGHNIPMIFGPDVATLNRDGYFQKFLENIDNDILDAVTFHFYYGASENATLQDFIDPLYLDKFLDYTNSAKKMIKKGATKDTPIWIGETASTYGGGAEALSDRYAAGFLWLDKLGLAARLNITMVIRQTLLGGKYALISKNLFPSPDYWLSVLYKQLVGHRVLDVTGSLEKSRKFRIYSHCVNEFGSHKYFQGSVVIIAINLDPREDMTFNLSGSLSNLAADEFVFEPIGDATARQVMLNGHLLELVDDVALPDFSPKPTSPPFVMPPLRYP